MFSWQQAPTNRPLVIAHRGGARLGPENAATTVRAALDAGADAIEVDIRMTADHRLVCFHDADLTRIAGLEHAVEDLSYRTLQQHVPSLMTLDEAVRGSEPGGLLLDVKTGSEDALSAIAQSVATARERVMLGLRSLALISAARSHDADIAVLAFLSDPDLGPQARFAGATWFRLWQADADVARVAAVQCAGLRCAVMVGQPRSVPGPEWPPFPVGLIDTAGLRSVLAARPDGILLDDPRLLQPTASPRCHSDVA